MMAMQTNFELLLWHILKRYCQHSKPPSVPTLCMFLFIVPDEQQLFVL